MLLLRIHDFLIDKSVKQGVFYVFSVERTRINGESALRLDAVGNEPVHSLVKGFQKSDAEARDEMPLFVSHFDHAFCAENVAKHNKSFHDFCHRFSLFAVQDVGLFGGELHVVFHILSLLAHYFPYCANFIVLTNKFYYIDIKISIGILTFV